MSVTSVHNPKADAEFWGEQCLMILRMVSFYKQKLTKHRREVLLAKLNAAVASLDGVPFEQVYRYMYKTSGYNLSAVHPQASFRHDAMYWLDPAIDLLSDDVAEGEALFDECKFLAGYVRAFLAAADGKTLAEQQMIALTK